MEADTVYGDGSQQDSNETVEECLTLNNATVKYKHPKVFIRIERSLDKAYYSIANTKTLLLKPIKSHRILPMSKKSRRSHFSFECDEILYKVGQEEAFSKVALQMTDRAMQGYSGVLLFVGVLSSGKSYSLFGDNQNLGIAHQIIERMDYIVRKQCSGIKITFSMSFLDIDSNVIRDCLFDGKIIEDLSSAKRKPFRTVVRGFILILKALQSIKDRCNTVVYIYINGQYPEQNISFRSTITLAEIASTIPRPTLAIGSPMSTKMENEVHQVMKDIMRIGFERACVERNEPTFSVSPSKKMMSSNDSVWAENDRSEDIPIRKDLFILENMFVTFAKKSKEQIYFEELKALGLIGKMERPKFNHKPFFNTSKMAVALREIFTGSCDLRVFVHLVPRGEFTFENLKVLRFAVRASIMPINTKKLP